MQAATAVKQRIETFGDGQQYAKKFTVSYSNPYSNPFKTLPKDGPLRNNASANTNRAMSGGMQPYSGSGYRGRGGGYNSRGGGMGNNNNRGGFQQQMGSFQGTGIGGWPGMTGMQPYGGFQGRGGMMNGMRGANMGMRGGRGSMMGMPMNMGAIGMTMGMPQMNAMGMPGTQLPQLQGSPPPLSTCAFVVIDTLPYVRLFGISDVFYTQVPMASKGTNRRSTLPCLVSSSTARQDMETTLILPRGFGRIELRCYSEAVRDPYLDHVRTGRSWLIFNQTSFAPCVCLHEIMNA